MNCTVKYYSKYVLRFTHKYSIPNRIRYVGWELFRFATTYKQIKMSFDVNYYLLILKYSISSINTYFILVNHHGVHKNDFERSSKDR